MKSHSPFCSLVGAGPGDPGLLTLRAKECIETADVLVYDYLCNPVFLDWARPDAEKIYAGKKAGHHTLKQPEINALLVEKALAGKYMVRLKGGDPYVFGRGGEEAEALVEAGVGFEIVPGISSAIAGPAYAGIPVTHRAHNAQLTILTGHEDPEKSETSVDWAHVAKTPGTRVLLMSIDRLDAITRRLMEHGADPETPVALVRWATTPRQETLVGTLKTIAALAVEQGFKAPAVTIIGDVVGMRDQLAWFDKRPLFGKRIVVTRTREQAGSLSRELARLGADVLELPTIRIDPPDDPAAFDEMVLHAHEYNWLVFTSPNGAERFFSRYYELREDAREIGGARIAAVGPSTAKVIRSYRFAVDLLPEEYLAEGLIKAFTAESIENLNMLVIRPQENRDVLVDGLTRLGAIVDSAIAYKTVPETTGISQVLQNLRENGADAITFTSASTVNHFLDLRIPWPDGMKSASIGPVTSAALREHGLEVDIEAPSHDIPGLVQALQESLILRA